MKRRRYEQIMEAIDEGMTDEELADIFDRKAERRDLALKTMHVYRMVHDHTLPRYEETAKNGYNRPGKYNPNGMLTIAEILERYLGRHGL